MQAEVVKLLSMDGAATLRKAEDSFGYHWLVVEDADIEALVTQIHLVNSSLSDAGWGPQLLCSVFGLARMPDGSGDDDGVGQVVGAGAGDGSDSGGTAGQLTAGPGRVLASTAYLVYLFKRGTFYPFVPTGREKRDTEEELKLKSLVADDLVVETDLDRWFPLWDLPVG
jgi:hypothetical protein